MRRLLVTLLAALALAGCATPLPTFDVRPLADIPRGGPTAPEGVGTAAPPVAGTALDVLAGLEVKGRAPRTGYDRDQFGDGWADLDGDGCDTRAAILRRDALTSTLVDGCVDDVTILDPYSGAEVVGRGEIDIDHVVALGDAWQKGAQQMSPGARLRFANDPLNLLAVDDGLNRQKGDGDAATWLPPATGYRCAYVARQIAVKASYGLWVTEAERDAMTRILADCPAEPVPAP